MNMFPRVRVGLTMGCVLMLSGCAALSPVARDSHAEYAAALADAAVASPGKVVALRPLPADPAVAMVSWVTDQRVPCARDALPCEMKVGADRLWVTLAGEVQGLCSHWSLQGAALRSRLEQLLGLPTNAPPQYRKTHFVILEIPRESIERPCLGVRDNASGQPVCTIDTQVDTPVTMRNFVGQQMASAYVMDNPKGPGYPYTRLGYTYDWASNALPTHYGASEFVVAPGSPIKAVQIIATDDYCAVR